MYIGYIVYYVNTIRRLLPNMSEVHRILTQRVEATIPGGNSLRKDVLHC